MENEEIDWQQIQIESERHNAQLTFRVLNSQTSEELAMMSLVAFKRYGDSTEGKVLQMMDKETVPKYRDKGVMSELEYRVFQSLKEQGVERVLGAIPSVGFFGGGTFQKLWEPNGKSGGFRSLQTRIKVAEKLQIPVVISNIFLIRPEINPESGFQIGYNVATLLNGYEAKTDDYVQPFSAYPEQIIDFWEELSANASAHILKHGASSSYKFSDLGVLATMQGVDPTLLGSTS